MALIALIGLFILRYGARPRYVGLSVLVGAWGIFMGLRHTAMHAARDVGQGFSAEILGAHTYTWALFIFWVCVVTMGALLMRLKQGDVAGGAACCSARSSRSRSSSSSSSSPATPSRRSAARGRRPSWGRAIPIRFSFNPEALGLVARRVLARARVAARPVGHREAGRGRPAGRSGRRPARRAADARRQAAVVARAAAARHADRPRLRRRRRTGSCSRRRTASTSLTGRSRASSCATRSSTPASPWTSADSPAPRSSTAGR